MKLKHLLFLAIFLTMVSAACNLPFALQGVGAASVTPTVTQENATIPPSLVSTPTATTIPSPIILPSATASVTPFPTSDLLSIAPTFNPTVMSTENIPVTGGSGSQTIPNPITFAPTANPQKIFVGSCGTNQTTITVIINQPYVAGTVIVLDRLDQLPDGSTSSFGTGTIMNLIATGEYRATITAPSAKPVGGKGFNTKLDYKFAVLDEAGKLIASSFVYNDVAVTVCKP